jgi:hypothetical protein
MPTAAPNLTDVAAIVLACIALALIFGIAAELLIPPRHR